LNSIITGPCGPNSHQTLVPHVTIRPTGYMVNKSWWCSMYQWCTERTNWWSEDLHHWQNCEW